MGKWYAQRRKSIAAVVGSAATVAVEAWPTNKWVLLGVALAFTIFGVYNSPNDPKPPLPPVA